MQESTNQAKSVPRDRVDAFPLFRVLYVLVKNFELAHIQFPKLHKYTLGKKISLALLASLEHVITASVRKEGRSESLGRAIVELEKSRILIRLAHELRWVDTKRYEKLSIGLVEALRQVAAFLKVAKASPPKAD